jgi:hypothetical protein
MIRTMPEKKRITIMKASRFWRRMTNPWRYRQRFSLAITTARPQLKYGRYSSQSTSAELVNDKYAVHAMLTVETKG